MVKTSHILRKIRLRELKSNFKNYISVILIAMLSVALFTGLYSNYKQLNSNIDYSYELSNMGDYFITVNPYSDNQEYLKDYDYIKSQSDEAISRLYTNGTVSNESVLLIAYDEDTVSHPSEIVEGNDGILISSRMARSLNLSVGDTFTFELSYSFDDSIKKALSPYSQDFDYISDDKVYINLTIDGIMNHSEAISRTSDVSSLIYIKDDTFKQAIYNTLISNYNSSNDLVDNTLKSNFISTLNSLTIYNQFVIKSDVNQDIFTSYFNSKDNNNILLIMTRDTLPTNSSVESDRTQALQLLYVFPIVFYLVGVLVIITSISELINKDRQTIGTMSSLGISKKTIILHYSFFAVLITFIGGLLGAIIGPLLIPNVMNFKYKLLYTLPKKSILPFNLFTFLSFIVLFLVALIISIVASHKIVNQNTATIFRNKQDTKFKGILLEKIKFINKRIPLTLKMSLRNIKRHWSRSLMVIIGVLGCSALLACGFGIDDTINNGLSTDLEKFSYDIHFDITGMDVLDTIDSKIDSESEELMLLSTEAFTTTSSYRTSLYVLNGSHEVLNVNYNNEGVTIDKKVSKELNLKINDTITFKIDNINYSFKITYIEDLFLTHGIFISKDLLDSSLYIPNKCYLKSSLDINEVKNTLLTIDGVSNLITIDEFLDMAEDSLSGIRLITLTVKVFAIILAIVVIYNLALLNFKERIRDIATLKVLGFGVKDVAKTLLTEISILTCIGSILGMLLGMPLLKLLLMINEINVIEYLYHIKVSSYIIAFSLTFVVSIVINFFITLLTNKIKMVESLKSIE